MCPPGGLLLELYEPPARENLKMPSTHGLRHTKQFLQSKLGTLTKTRMYDNDLPQRSHTVSSKWTVWYHDSFEQFNMEFSILALINSPIHFVCCRPQQSFEMVFLL